MSIYFVRHGQTAWNLQGKMQGNTDIPLNHTGKKQAEMTREKLRHIKMDRIYCSPLTRAKETAEIINTIWKLPIQFDERLRERNFGEFEGQSSKGLDLQALWKQDANPPFTGAEDSLSFYQRITSFLDDIVDIAGKENILIVAHGGVSIPYYCYFHGYQKEDLSSLLLKNCEVRKMEGKKYSDVSRG